MRIIRVIFFVSFLIMSITVNAQEACAVIINSAAHDLSVSTIEKAANDERYEQDCGSSSKGSSTSVGLEYSGIGASFGQSKQSSSSFCKTKDERAASAFENYTYARTVVREAYSAYLACEQFRSSGVAASFEILPRTVLVTLQRMAYPVTLNRAYVSPVNSMACTRSNPDGGAPIPLVDLRPIALSDGGIALTVICERIDQDPGPEELFAGADVVIETSRRSVPITVKPIRFPTAVTTQQFIDRLAENERKLQLFVDLFTVKNVILEQWATSLSGVVSREDPSVTMYRESNQWFNGKCPNGQFVSGLIVKDSGYNHQNFHTQFVQLRCTPFPKFGR